MRCETPQAYERHLNAVIVNRPMARRKRPKKVSAGARNLRGAAWRTTLFEFGLRVRQRVIVVDSAWPPTLMMVVGITCWMLIRGQENRKRNDGATGGSVERACGDGHAEAWRLHFALDRIPTVREGPASNGPGRHVAELSHGKRKGSRPCASERLVGYDAVRRELFPQQYPRTVISTCSRLTQVVAKTKEKIWHELATVGGQEFRLTMCI